MTDDNVTRLVRDWARGWRSFYPSENALQCLEIAIREAMEDLKADRDRWADSACRLEKAQEKICADAYTRAAEVADHKKDCPVVLDDEGDQVLADYQTCTCDRNGLATAIEKLRDEK